MKFKIEKSPSSIFIAASAGGYFDDGTAPGAYVVVHDHRPESLISWGAGYVRSTHSLFAIGIAGEIRRRQNSGDANFRVFAKRAGFEKYLTEHIPAWLANNKRNGKGKRPEAYQDWLFLQELYANGSLQVAPSSECWHFARHTANATRLARQLVKAMELRGRSIDPSVFHTGDWPSFQTCTVPAKAPTRPKARKEQVADASTSSSTAPTTSRNKKSESVRRARTKK